MSIRIEDDVAVPSKSEGAIRLATTEDAAPIAELLMDAFVEYRDLYTRDGFAATAIEPAEVLRRISEGPMWVAVSGDEVIGTVAVVHKGESLYIRGMAIHPKARGQRLGERLLQTIEDYAAREGVTRLFLSTTPFLDRAIRLYEKSGFRRIDDGPRDLFGTPLFTMEKLLPKPNPKDFRHK